MKKEFSGPEDNSKENTHKEAWRHYRKKAGKLEDRAGGRDNSEEVFYEKIGQKQHL